VALFALSWVGVLNALMFILAIVLTFLILIQRGKGGGLIGALGGTGGASPFGSRAGDLFTRVTLIMALGWMVLSAVMILAVPKPEPSAGRPVVTQPEQPGP
jgi:preprotein translocase subunit SecG